MATRERKKINIGKKPSKEVLREEGEKVFSRNTQIFYASSDFGTEGRFSTGANGNRSQPKKRLVGTNYVFEWGVDFGKEGGILF